MVSKGRNHFLGYKDLTAAVAVLSFGESGLGAGRGYRSVCHFMVSKGRSSLM